MSDISRDSNHVQAVDRALLLLKYIAGQEQPVSLSRLCEISGLNRTTVWRLLCTLEDNGFVDRSPNAPEYELGLAAINLSTSLSQQSAPLIRRAHPVMQELVDLSEESVLLSVCRFSGIAAIDQIDPPQSICLKNYLNIITPLHCSSTGKVLLSHMPSAELDAYLRQPLEAVTEYTITDPILLRRQLRDAARNGYATVEGELSTDENGISAPLLSGGHLLALLSIGGPGYRLTAQRMRELAPALTEASRKISASFSEL